MIIVDYEYTLGNTATETDAFDPFTVVNSWCPIIYSLTVVPSSGTSLFTLDTVTRTVSIFGEETDLALAYNAYTLEVTA